MIKISIKSLYPCNLTAKTIDISNFKYWTHHNSQIEISMVCALRVRYKDSKISICDHCTTPFIK